MFLKMGSFHSSDLFIVVQRLRNLMSIENKGCNQVFELSLARVAVTEVLSFSVPERSMLHGLGTLDIMSTIN